MYAAKGYSAASEKSPLASTTIARRDPTESDAHGRVCRAALHRSWLSPLSLNQRGRGAVEKGCPMMHWGSVGHLREIISYCCSRLVDRQLRLQNALSQAVKDLVLVFCPSS